MSTTEPIRDEAELIAFFSYYKSVKVRPRNYCMVVLGVNTALRISDVLQLTWQDIYDFDEKIVRHHIELNEIKTGKHQKIAINQLAASSIQYYLDSIGQIPTRTDYVFSVRTRRNQPITRVQAYRIVKEAATYSIKNPLHISCHSLRKTFGYHAWKQGAQPALLMDVYNHSNYAITKHYLGISQDEKDSLYLKIKFNL